MPVGVGKLFKGKSITQHGLAVILAGDDPKEVHVQNGIVRSVSIAAGYYGLFERVSINRTKVSIRGTELLHNYMLEYAKVSYDVVCLCSLSPPTDHRGEN
jgi:hypothetical protein